MPTIRLPRIPNTPAWGIGLALATAAISGVSVYLNAFAVRQVPDAAVYTTLKNGVAALVLIGLLGLTGARGGLRGLGTRRWLGLVLIGAIGGSVPFLLFFTGLAQASAPSAAVIHKTMFIWVALLALPLLGERPGWAQAGALVALLAAQAMILPPAGVSLGGGEGMIAAATGMWAVEVILAKRLLRSVDPQVLGAARMGFGLVLLVAFLVATGKVDAVGALGASAWAWVGLTGVLLAGYVATWFAALKRASAVSVTAVLTLAAVITAGLQLVGSGAMPKAMPAAGYAIVLVASLVVAWVAARRAATFRGAADR